VPPYWTSRPMILLSQHFLLEEFTRSELAIRHSIDNTPPPDVLENLKLLAETLERVRSILNHPLHISSGYRCPALNVVARGSKTSAHMSGLAADFSCPGFGTPSKIVHELALCKPELNFDQVILEFPPNGWVHLGISGVPRGQVLTYNGQTYERFTA